MLIASDQLSLYFSGAWSHPRKFARAMIMPAFGQRRFRRASKRRSSGPSRDSCRNWPVCLDGLYRFHPPNQGLLERRLGFIGSKTSALQYFWNAELMPDLSLALGLSRVVYDVFQ